MRAFISDRSKRYRVAPASLAVRATWAEREAGAILADTEPGQFDACSGARHFGPRETARTESLVGHGRAALAEALAAFLEG